MGSSKTTFLSNPFLVPFALTVIAILTAAPSAESTQGWSGIAYVKEIGFLAKDNGLTESEIQPVAKAVDFKKIKVEKDDPKERLYSLIKANSMEGISFKELKQIFSIPDDQLRGFLRDLEMESRIYQSEEDVYQTY